MCDTRNCAEFSMGRSTGHPWGSRFADNSTYPQITPVPPDETKRWTRGRRHDRRSPRITTPSMVNRQTRKIYGFAQLMIVRFDQVSCEPRLFQQTHEQRPRGFPDRCPSFHISSSVTIMAGRRSSAARTRSTSSCPAAPHHPAPYRTGPRRSSAPTRTLHTMTRREARRLP